MRRGFLQRWAACSVLVLGMCPGRAWAGSSAPDAPLSWAQLQQEAKELEAHIIAQKRDIALLEHDAGMTQDPSTETPSSLPSVQTDVPQSSGIPPEKPPLPAALPEPPPSPAQLPTASSAPTSAAFVTADSKDGFSIKSADGAYALKLKGFVQADARVFAGNKGSSSAGTDNFLMRRARLYVLGILARDFSFALVPDFAATIGSSGGTFINQGYVEYVKYPAFQVRGGKFTEPFSVESLQDPKFTSFAETGLPSNLYPQRDIGLQFSGSVLHDQLKYALGLFNGQVDREAYFSSTSNTDVNNDKDVVGRIWISPFKDASLDMLHGLGLGFAAAYGHQDETKSNPTYVSPGQVTVFSYSAGVSADGPRLRTSPQLTYYYKSLGVLGEYVTSRQEWVRNSPSLMKDKFDNSAWQLSLTYVLTGENAAYSGVVPRHDFDWAKRTWGAFELAARYGELMLDPRIFDDGFADLSTSVSKESAMGLGLNWYLNQNIKLVLDFEQTRFRRGAGTAGAPANRKAENVITSRFQVSY